jgi:hypothetical protein
LNSKKTLTTTAAAAIITLTTTATITTTLTTAMSVSTLLSFFRSSPAIRNCQCRLDETDVMPEIIRYT